MEANNSTTLANKTAQPYFHPPVIQKRENAFKPDMLDFLFALGVLALGYLFSRWVLFWWSGWGVAVFTTAYLFTVTTYLIKKGVFTRSPEVWFWMAITWATGLSYALWDNAGFTAIRALFLFSAAVYYVTLASNRTIFGRTSNYLLMDGINSIIVLPFRNFINQYVSFSVPGKNGKLLPCLLGSAVALILALILVPMLARADSGGFGLILEIFNFVSWESFAEFMFYAFFAVPCAAYIYGLMSGAAHGKGTDIIRREPMEKAAVALRLLHPTTVFIILGTVCVIYIVFILSQLPYFFSAFTGNRPDGWLIYSLYARQGFFELCGIAAINLAILTTSNLTCKKQRLDSLLLRTFNITLALITLVLIATAFSKMLLYIDAYGLTMIRLLPCVFMIFLAAVFIALIALQKWDFSIVRLALLSGAVILCVLCLSNPDAVVVRYNADRYLNGTLSEFDTAILYRAGIAGVKPAIEVYNGTLDDALRTEMSMYYFQSGWGGWILTGSNTHSRSFEHYRAVAALSAAGIKSQCH
jgi:hypothetical protein